MNYLTVLYPSKMNLFFKKKRYELAFIEAVHGSKISDCKWVVHKVINPYRKEKWFADPFILDYNDNEIIVLVEEMDFTINRGRLAKLIINRSDYIIKDLKILHDLDTHLSFPAIERIGNEVYVYPENSDSGKLCIYKYNDQDDKLECMQILVNEPLTDTIMRTVDGRKYLFSTKKPDPNGKHLYIYKNVNDKFENFQIVTFTDFSARSAGDWFFEENSWIRPAQDCNGYYGIGLVFQKVIYENGLFRFEEINRIKHPSGYDGLHTFNKYKEICVIDYRKPLYPFIYYPCKFVIDIIHKIL